MDSKVLFSIIIPTYNRAAFILKTIQSLLDQSYQNFEIIVVDDGSKDNTDEIVKGISDSRVSYYKKENGERGAARNYGLDRANGDYVNFFDSDDLAYPNHLASAHAVVEEKGNPEVFHLGYDIKAPSGKLLAEYNNFNGDIENDAIKVKRISINALFIKTTVAKEIKFSENRLLSASEDALFLCRLCVKYQLLHKNIVTSTIIEHDSRSMTIASEQQLINRQKYLVEELQADEIFMNKYGYCINDIIGEMDYLLCLSCLAIKNKKKAWQYFKSYRKNKKASLFNRRTLTFIKKMLLN